MADAQRPSGSLDDLKRAKAPPTSGMGADGHTETNCAQSPSLPNDAGARDRPTYGNAEGVFKGHEFTVLSQAIFTRGFNNRRCPMYHRQRARKINAVAMRDLKPSKARLIKTNLRTVYTTRTVLPKLAVFRTKVDPTFLTEQ